jgi:hypothetical protein
MTLALVVTLLLTQAPDAGDAVSPVPAQSPVEDPRDARIQALEEQLGQLQTEVEALHASPSWISKLAASFGGYLDLGFFWAQGDGSGVRKDFGHVYAPQYSDQLLGTWVLLGDPLSTTINSRGDVADLGDGRALRDDPVHSGGRPSFIVNNLSLALLGEIADGLTLHGRVDFVPRDRGIASFSDLVELKLAYLRYQLELGPIVVVFSGGKFDSVLGLEYRSQEAPSRLTVTPSLICRYTCGRPTGLKLQGLFFQKLLDVTVSLTNGSHQISTFGFANETDFNGFKTLAGRLIVTLPVEPRIELNASAAIGPQDRQPDDQVLQWHYGFGASFDHDRFFASAEFVKGHATGKAGNVQGREVPCGAAPCLDYRGLYVQGGIRLATWLSIYSRFDWRHAIHRDGDRFIYLSDVARATAGVNVHPWKWLVVKAEYVFNREVASAGYEFPDDVFTTSLAVRY